MIASSWFDWFDRVVLATWCCRQVVMIVAKVTCNILNDLRLECSEWKCRVSRVRPLSSRSESSRTSSLYCLGGGFLVEFDQRAPRIECVCWVSKTQDRAQTSRVLEITETRVESTLQLKWPSWMHSAGVRPRNVLFDHKPRCNKKIEETDGKQMCCIRPKARATIFKQHVRLMCRSMNELEVEE